MFELFLLKHFFSATKLALISVQHQKSAVVSHMFSVHSFKSYCCTGGATVVQLWTLPPLTHFYTDFP